MRRTNSVIPHADDLRNVRRAFDVRALQARCQRSLANSFSQLEGQGGILSGKPPALHVFKDNDAKVLAIAHLDTVQNANDFYRVNLGSQRLVFSPRLDDRLGVYTILDLLPRLGVNVDVLLTENEEIGASTAQDFFPGKDYNWIVQFDRTGETTVTYHYDWGKSLDPYFDLDTGTFSDISMMEHLGCKGLNVGVGYHDEHSLRAYMDIDQYMRQIARFLRFYRDNHDLRFPHVQTTPTRGYFDWGGDWDDRDTIGWCGSCHADLKSADVEVCGQADVRCKDCGSEVYLYMDADLKGLAGMQNYALPDVDEFEDEELIDVK